MYLFFDWGVTFILPVYFSNSSSSILVKLLQQKRRERPNPSYTKPFSNWYLEYMVRQYESTLKGASGLRLKSMRGVPLLWGVSGYCLWLFTIPFLWFCLKNKTNPKPKPQIIWSKSEHFGSLITSSFWGPLIQNTSAFHSSNLIFTPQNFSNKLVTLWDIILRPSLGSLCLLSKNTEAKSQQ